MKKNHFIVFSTLLLVGGCDRVSDVFDWLSGVETNVVILENGSTTIGEKPKKYNTDSKTIIVGEKVSVCLSLRGDFPLGPSEMMRKEYEQLLNGVEITASIYTKEGAKIVVDSLTQSWSKYGVIEKHNELSACLALNCKEENLEVGTIINNIEIKASDTLQVRGIFWESTNRWDNIN